MARFNDAHSILCAAPPCAGLVPYPHRSVHHPRHSERSEESLLNFVAPCFRSSRCEHRAYPAAGLCRTTNLCRIRTSENLLLQPLPNQHLQTLLGSAESKGLTARKLPPQALSFQHLRASLVTAEYKRLITPLDSALPRKCPRNPFGIRTSGKQGVGGIPPWKSFFLRELSLYCQPLTFNFQLSTSVRMFPSPPICPLQAWRGWARIGSPVLRLRAAEPPAPPQSGGQRPRRNS
jgi:hypothetical protein